jgi:hypothetical protein
MVKTWWREVCGPSWRSRTCSRSSQKCDAPRARDGRATGERLDELVLRRTVRVEGGTRARLRIDAWHAAEARSLVVGIVPVTSTSRPPTGSWLNLVERWFAELTTKKIKRGAHTSVPALERDIRGWIVTWNENPRPYVWVKTADQILASLARYCGRISNSGH